MDITDMNNILMVQDVMLASLMVANLNQNLTLGSVRVTLQHSVK